MKKSELRAIIREEITNLSEATEPTLITSFRMIVTNRQNDKVTCPITGKTHRVDLFTASKVVQIYDRLPASVKNKFGSEPLLKMVDIAMKF